jgi:hypothetical protein
MRVTKLFRYPVKSLQGEALDAAEVGPFGLVGDRQFGLLDVDGGSVMTGRRDPELLMATGRLTGNGSAPVAVVLPDGRTATAEDLSAWLGKPVRVVQVGRDTGTFEAAADPMDEDGEWVPCPLPAGAFHDVDHRRVSINAEGELRDWDIRRFRPNVVVSGDSTADLVGKRLRLGEVELEVQRLIDRCGMVNRQQPGIEADRTILRTIRRDHDMLLGAGATVTRGGTIRLGDELEILA